MAPLSRRHVLGSRRRRLERWWLRAREAAETGPIHGISVFGDLKYPADFQHFDYVNIAAPKGGMFSLIPSVRAYNQSYQTFNSLNAFVLKGEGAQGMDMTFAPLMVRADDEPMRCTAWRRSRCRFRRTSSPIVSLCGRGQVSRRLEIDGA